MSPGFTVLLRKPPRQGVTTTSQHPWRTSKPESPPQPHCTLRDPQNPTIRGEGSPPPPGTPPLLSDCLARNHPSVNRSKRRKATRRGRTEGGKELRSPPLPFSSPHSPAPPSCRCPQPAAPPLSRSAAPGPPRSRHGAAQRRRRASSRGPAVGQGLRASEKPVGFSSLRAGESAHGSEGA